MNSKNLNRKVNFLTFYAIASSIIFMVLIFMSFNKSEKKENLDELTVKRINIVDETGENLRMVISNETRQHPGIINGKKLEPRKRHAGMIFFNSFGDECGGFIYDGNKENAGMVLSVDQFRDDQIMQLQYMEDTKSHSRKYGLQLWDYPKENSNTERNNRFEKLDLLTDKTEKKKEYEQMKMDRLLMEDRLFIGKDFNKNVGLFIKDKTGKPRIKIYIDSNDNPVIELLDKNGKTIK